MTIGIHGVTKQFNDFTALRGIDFEIRTGELVALLGPSGSGKTTLLRIIAGLEWPDRGEIHLGGKDASLRSVRERRVGFVFQHYALFQHLTAFENVAFGLRVQARAQRGSEAWIRERVESLLELVQLRGLGGRFPAQLSGGQRQRVALARALAIEPSVLLLDEPFGALDAKVRKELRHWLRGLHEKIEVTSVFVTHDQEEALEIADRIVVMNRGTIEQIGTPQAIYERPATAFVHEFIGDSVAIPVTVQDGTVQFQGQATGLGVEGVAAGQARLFARPHEMHIVAPGAGAFAGTVKRILGFGPTLRLDIALGSGDDTVEINAPPGAALSEGQEVHLAPQRYRVFGAN
jgi:sulfate/thiosulfate transport system ATP-binding protein